MQDLLLYLWNSNQHFAQQLLADIPEEKMTLQPQGLPNHPAWTLAHLSVASNSFLLPTLSVPPMELTGWETKFGYGSKPTANRSDYPSKAELLDIYNTQHRLVGEAIKTKLDSLIGVQTPDESMRAYFPTLDRMVGYLVSIHEANHWGQIADWRRAQGYPSVM